MYVQPSAKLCLAKSEIVTGNVFNPACVSINFVFESSANNLNVTSEVPS